MTALPVGWIKPTLKSRMFGYFSIEKSELHPRHALLVVYVVLGISVSGILTTANQSRSDTVDAPFASKLSNKIRIALISKFNDFEKAEFLKLIQKADSSEKFDSDKWSDELNSTDVMLFILSNWDDTKKLPYQETFSSYFESAGQTDVTAVKVMFEISVNNGRPFLLVFYNLSAAPYATQQCIADNFVEGLSLGESFVSNPIKACK